MPFPLKDQILLNKCVLVEISNGDANSMCCSSRCSNRITLLPATDLKLGDVVLDESFFNIMPVAAS